MLQTRKIKKADERKNVSDVASPEPEGIATTIKLKRGEKARFDLAFNSEQKGKRWRHKPKKKRIVPANKKGQKVVSRERPELPTINVTVDGTTYTRAHEEGKGRAQEVLLRHGDNLENMVREVRRITFEALSDGVYKPEDTTMTACNRGLTLIQGLCTEKGAFNASLFETTEGKPMQDNFAFGMMVRQFFRDASFAGEVVGQASREYSEMKNAAAAPSFHTEPQMAAGFATVDGTYYRRTFPTGDREAELIVRRNLEEFVRGAISAVKMAAEQERSPQDAESYCYPPEGVLEMRKFETVDHQPIKDETLFRRAIAQFFYDSEMVKKATRQALSEK